MNQSKQNTFIVMHKSMADVARNDLSPGQKTLFYFMIAIGLFSAISIVLSIAAFFIPSSSNDAESNDAAPVPVETTHEAVTDEPVQPDPPEHTLFQDENNFDVTKPFKMEERPPFYKLPRWIRDDIHYAEGAFGSIQTTMHTTRKLKTKEERFAEADRVIDHEFVNMPEYADYQHREKNPRVILESGEVGYFTKKTHPQGPCKTETGEDAYCYYVSMHAVWTDKPGFLGLVYVTTDDKVGYLGGEWLPGYYEELINPSVISDWE